MPDAHVNDATDETLDPLDAELRSLIAERRMDEILANLPCGNTTISAGGIRCAPRVVRGGEPETLG